MSFNNVFNAVISYWPDLIEFQDGILYSNNGFRSEKLYIIWTSIEDKILTTYPDNKDMDLMVYCIYQVIHSHIIESFKKGIYAIKISSIPISEFKDQYERNEISPQ